MPPPPVQAGPPARAVKSADRAVDVLEVLAAGPHRLTLSELHRSLGVPKSSLYGLLQTLVARGWLETDLRGTSYGIGLRALRVGVAYLARDATVQAAGPVLAQVRRETDETVHLARLDGPDIVYLASRESGHQLRTSSRIGQRLPAHATALGKVLLAERQPAEVDSLLVDPLSSLTPDTIVDRDVLKAELAEIRVRGWAFERGQAVVGICCIAIAVPSHRPATDALSCSIPLARYREEHARTVVDSLVRAAEHLAEFAGEDGDRA